MTAPHERLRARLGDPALYLDDPADTARYARDWIGKYVGTAPLVVRPRTTEEVAHALAACTELDVPVVPQAGNTGMVGGGVPRAGEVVLSVERLNAIEAFDEASATVTVQAGVVLETLQGYLAERGYDMPVDLGGRGSCQIGGMIATNAGGVKVLRYGHMREQVRGLEVVLADGTVVSGLNILKKNNTGLDLKQVFIGSEGTLGFIVQADIRLLPAPLPARVMVLGIQRFADVLNVLQAFQCVLTLSAFEFFSELALTKVIAHREVSRPFARASNFYALIEFDAVDEEAALGAFETVVEQGWAAEGVVSRSDAQSQSLWTLRDGITESIAAFTPYKNDISVRVSDVPAFLDDIDRLVESHYPDFEVCWFGHIGDGNLHLNILKPGNLDADTFYEQCHGISPALFEAIRDRRGSISAEHGVGLLKRDFLHYSRSSREIALMRQLKSVFDPNGVMNPGKLLAP